MKRIVVLCLELAGIAFVAGAVFVSPSWVQLYAIGVSSIVVANALAKTK